MLNKPLISWFLSLWIAVAPLYEAHGQQSSPNSLGDTSLSVKVDRNDSSKVIIESTQPGSTLKIEMPNSDEKEISRYSPKNLTSGFAKWSKEAGKESLHTLQRLPRESFLFFLAIGGVTAFQLFTQYANNPMGMSQHIEHSLSPVGVAGFYSFMHFNGVSTRALNKVLTDKKFANFIPYMGMTVGFTAQTVLSTFMADPLIKTCVAMILGNHQSAHANAQLTGIAPQNACDEAFEFYAMKRRLYEIAPGLISMIGSTAISGLLQKGMTSGLFQLTGIDIAFLFVPGVGWSLTALRFAVVSTVQMGVFYYLDQGLMARPINFVWKNVVDQGDITNRQNNIVSEVSKNKINGWQDTKKLQLEMKRFSELASAWRMTNLMEVYEGHQYWNDKINQVTALYDVSYDFLSQFVDEARNSKWRISEPYRLELIEPLYGVSALGLNEGHENAYFLRPTMTEPMAKDNFTRVSLMLNDSLSTALEKLDFSYLHANAPAAYRIIKSMQANLSNRPSPQANTAFQRAKKNSKNSLFPLEVQDAFSKLAFSYLLKSLKPIELNSLRKINALMKVLDTNRMSQAILEIRRQYADQSQNTYLTANYKIALYNLLLELGTNPNPMKYPGQGFMNSYV